MIELQSVLCDSDEELLQRVVHQLAGSAHNYGYPQISECALELQGGLRSGAIEPAAKLSQAEGLIELIERALLVA